MNRIPIHLDAQVTSLGLGQLEVDVIQLPGQCIVHRVHHNERLADELIPISEVLSLVRIEVRHRLLIRTGQDLLDRLELRFLKIGLDLVLLRYLDVFSDVIVEPLRGRQVGKSIQDIHREFAFMVLILRHLSGDRINFFVEQTEYLPLAHGCNIIQLPEHLGGSVLEVAVVTFAHY